MIATKLYSIKVFPDTRKPSFPLIKSCLTARETVANLIRDISPAGREVSALLPKVRKFLRCCQTFDATPVSWSRTWVDESDFIFELYCIINHRFTDITLGNNRKHMLLAINILKLQIKEQKTIEISWNAQALSAACHAFSFVYRHRASSSFEYFENNTLSIDINCI